MSVHRGRSRERYETRSLPIGTKSQENDLKKAIEILAALFSKCEDDLNVTIRPSQPQDWEVSEEGDVRVKFKLSVYSSMGWFELYFRKKLNDPLCSIGFETRENGDVNFVLCTNYLRILTFYSWKYWLITWVKANFFKVFFTFVLAWYAAVFYYGYWYGPLEIVKDVMIEPVIE